MQKVILILLATTCLCSVALTAPSAQCMADLTALKPSLQAIAADAAAKNYAQLEADVISAFPTVQTAVTECTGYTPTASCNSDILALKPAADRILADIVAQDLTQLTKDINSASPDVTVALYDCIGFTVTAACTADLMGGIPFIEAVVADVEAEDYGQLVDDITANMDDFVTGLNDCNGISLSSACQGDLLGALPTIETLIKDIEAENYSQLISDLLNAIPAIEEGMVDCTGHALTQSCEAAVLGLLPTVQTIAADVSAGNFAQLITDVHTALPTVQAAIQTCSAATTVIGTLPTLDSECLNDVMGLTPIVEGILGDLEAGDYSNLMTSVLNAVPRLEAAVSACTGLDSVVMIKESAECHRRVQDLLTSAEKFVGDIEDGDFSDLINVATNAVSQVEAAVGACIRGI